MQTVYTVLTLLLVVGATRLAAQLLPLPLPLIQIAAGALLALPSLGLHIALDPELFLFLFIPPLLFVDGWRIPKREVWRMRWPILMMAFGLVFFTVVGAGYFIHLLIPEIPWRLPSPSPPCCRPRTPWRSRRSPRGGCPSA